MNQNAGDIEGTGDGGDIGVRAKTLANDASKQIIDAASRQAQRGMSALGNKIEDAASFVEHKVAEVSREREVPPAQTERVQQVTNAMHSAATYLRENDPKQLATDVDDAVHRHPYRAMFVALGVGWVIGRLARRD